MSRRRRLDAEMVRRTLVDSRSQAQALIVAGHVTVSGTVADKPARQVDPGEAIQIVGSRPGFVSRGGEKLAAALDGFGLDPNGRRVIDVGSSTGGFTDCVLQRGAAEVVSIDVGRNQLHERMRADPRVEVREQTDVRLVEPADIGGPADLVVADLSFISLRSVAEALVALVRPGGDLVALVKPQFEAGKAEADKGRGVIRDPEVWRRTLRAACGALVGCGAGIMGVMVSPITGREGNVEFLVHARAGGPGTADVEARCDAAVRLAEQR